MSPDKAGNRAALSCGGYNLPRSSGLGGRQDSDMAQAQSGLTGQVP